MPTADTWLQRIEGPTTCSRRRAFHSEKKFSGWIIHDQGARLAAGGVLNRLIDFLTLLGVLIPPVATIMAVEYYVVRTWRRELSESVPGLPATEPTWIPGALAVWVLAALAGELLPWGVASVNSLLVVVLLYPLFARLGLLKPARVVPTTLSVPTS